MTKKERVAAAIKREPVDRVPYNFAAENDTQEKLYRHFGFHDYDMLLDAFNPDILRVNADFPPEKDMGGYYQNCWGERYVYRQTEYGPVREDMAGALSGATTLKELQDFDWPKNGGVDYSRLPGMIDRHPDMAVQYGAGDIWQRPGLVRGMENFMMDMAIQPEFCHYLSNLFCEFYIEEYRRAQKAAGGRIMIFTIYSDLGSQQAPLISLEMFREFVLPYVKRMADVIHELGAALFFHSCGMIYPFINELIAAGVDIIDPIQPCCAKMQPENLAREFGGRVCFNGGIDVQKLLVLGSPDDVKAQAARYKNCFKDGGYICSPSHFLQSDAPVENMLAVYEETMNELA